MKNAEIVQKLRKEMEKVLKPGRLDHSLGVAYTAANLAMVHGADIQKALIAGMLHDCAKNLSEQEQLQFCRKHHIDVTEVEEENTALLHAKNGEWMAAHKYHIDDPEILGAIRWHTTGRPGMTLLEKIIYVADFIEPNRKKLECLPAIRQEAYRDIDATVYHIAEAVTGFLSTQGKATDDMSMKTLRYYQDILEGRRKDGGTE